MNCKHESGFVEEGNGAISWKRCIACRAILDVIRLRGFYRPAFAKILARLNHG